MAFVHGKTSHLAFGTDTTEDNISTYTDSVDFPREVEEVETTTFGATAKTFLLGFEESTVSAEGPWDTALDALLAPKLGSATAYKIVYGPAGNTGGYVRYKATAILKSYSVTGGVSDPVRWSAEWRISGAVTRDTF